MFSIDVNITNKQIKGQFFKCLKTSSSQSTMQTIIKNTPPPPHPPPHTHFLIITSYRHSFNRYVFLPTGQICCPLTKVSPITQN